MAKNFKMEIQKNDRNLKVKLSGDFDGSSAHELIHLLKNSGKYKRADICTNGLSDVYGFGQNVWTAHARAFKEKVQFSGAKAIDFNF